MGRIPHCGCPRLPWVPRSNADEQKKKMQLMTSLELPHDLLVMVFMFRDAAVQTGTSSSCRCLSPVNLPFLTSDPWHYFLHTAVVAHRLFSLFEIILCKAWRWLRLCEKSHKISSSETPKPETIFITFRNSSIPFLFSPSEASLDRNISSSARLDPDIFPLDGLIGHIGHIGYQAHCLYSSW